MYSMKLDAATAASSFATEFDADGKLDWKNHVISSAPSRAPRATVKQAFRNER